MSQQQSKGIWQQIINNQDKLDKRVILEHDLFDEKNNVSLVANFDINRKESIKFGYSSIKSTVKFIRSVGAKWWKKNLAPITNEENDEIRNDLIDGVYNVEVEGLSNISMKNLAIIQEVLELEQAIEEGKSKEEVYYEYIDVIHFVVSLGLEIGIKSEEQIRELYEKKNQINHTRLNEHY